jgi:mono/diheme cytochrome c family protein
VKGSNHLLDAGAKAALASLLLGAVAAASACGGGGPRKAEDAPPARELFRRYCATCHGQAGEGGALGRTRVPGFKSDFVVNLTDEQLHKWIADGGSNMPSFKNTLTQDQMRDLVKHIRELQKQ